MSSLNEQITSFLESVGEDNDILHFLYNMNNKKFDRKNQSIYYSGPFWDNKEVVAIIETLLSGKWLVSGEKVNKFERQFSKKFGHSASVMVNSGSSANLVMIAALKKYFDWHDDDEIIVSPVGFPTTIAPLLQNNLTPVFIDIDIKDLNFNLDEIEQKITKKTKGIFVSPVLGNPPDMDQLTDLAKKHNIEIILDNCDSLGSKWNDSDLSSYAVASSCSFYPAHHITTGEGGMVSSNIEKIVDLARSFAWWGRDCYCVGPANLLTNGTCKKRFDKWLPDVDILIDHKYVFSNIGYNLKPLDMQGAIGIEQLLKFDDIHKMRRLNKRIISEFFIKYIKGVRIVEEHKKSETSWFGVPVVCDTPLIKEKLVKYLEDNKIQTRNYFAGNILQHPAYSHLEDASSYPISNSVLRNIFFVGCSPTYSDEMLEYIESVLKNFSLN
jgi:CDP-4-dehydro-6-deoxyglucose reductase, E1